MSIPFSSPPIPSPPLAMSLQYWFIALRRLIYIVVSKVKDTSVTVGLYLWDFLLVLFNLITPDLPAGHVISEGDPGYQGQWPKYSPPGEGDSRSPCPGLNAMANHGRCPSPSNQSILLFITFHIVVGIIPRNGKNIKFSELHTSIKKTYNMAVPFSHFLPRGAAQLLTRDLAHDSFDLADLSVHNMIEHDASFCREYQSPWLL